MDNIKMPSHDNSKVITFGLSVIFIVFFLIGGWMSFAPLSSSSVAVGEVSADIDKKKIQHLEGGIVKKIYVKDGDKVKKGDILLKLDEIQYKSELEILNSQYQDALGVYARAKALEDDKDRIVFSKELIDRNIIENQRNIFETTKKRIDDEKAITKNKIFQLNKQIEGLSSVLKSKKQRLSSLSEEIIEWEELLKEKLVDKLKVRELKRERNSIEGEISNTISEIARLKEQIEEVKIEQLLREKNFKNENLDYLVKSKSKIEDLKSKIEANKDKLKRTNIYSPINGTVVGLNLHTDGAVIRPGDDILEIVPENSKLIVVARVQTADIDKVKTGLHADIRFSAFNLQQAHVISGEVIHVSADSFYDEQSSSSYYESKIQVTDEGEKQLKEYGFILVSGMPAEVMINLGERTPLSYLVKPFTDMLARGFNEE